MLFLAVDLLTIHHTGGFSFRVVEIDKVQAGGGAYRYACGVQPFFNPVLAQRAFIGISSGVHETGIVRTCRQAGLAACAAVGFDLDSPVAGVV